QGRRRRGPVLAPAAGGLVDHLRPRGLRLAPPPPGPARLPAAAGRLRRGRGPAPLQAPRQVHRPRPRQVARRPLRQLTVRPAALRADHLPRPLRRRPVSVRLPAGPRALGHAPCHPGVAPGRRGAGPRRPLLAAGPAGRPRPVAAIAAGRRPPGCPGTPPPGGGWGRPPLPRPPALLAATPAPL